MFVCNPYYDYFPVFRMFFSFSPENYFVGGLNDQSVEGIWRWHTGAILTYDKWDGGQPNGGTSGQSDQDCVVVNDAAGKWHDRDCSDTQKMLCSTLGRQNYLHQIKLLYE